MSAAVDLSSLSRLRRGAGRGVPAAARAYTLIELLAVVAVIALLVAIAVPSYTSYLMRGQRAQAKAALLQLSQSMERYYTANGSYLNAGAIPLAPVNGTAACLALAPADNSTVTYCVSGAPQGNGYLLSATPCGDGGAGCPAGANTNFVDPDCDVLTIDNTGAKGASGSAGVTACWQR